MTIPRVIGAMITLDIISPSGERQRKSFDAVPVSIGRQVGQLRIQDPGVSALHGQLAVEDGVLCYRDLGSTNGSFGADGTPIESSMNLATGDRVRLGEHQLCLVEFTQATRTPDPANQTMVYPPSRAPWSKSPSVGPSWKAKTSPSQSEPKAAPAPVAPRDMPAPEGTIFGRLDLKTGAPTLETKVGNQTQVIPGPEALRESPPQVTPDDPAPLRKSPLQTKPRVPNLTVPVAPPPPRGTPIAPASTEPFHPHGEKGKRLTPAAPEPHTANTSFLTSLRVFSSQPLRVLLSGPALWLCGALVALSMLFSQGVANQLMMKGSILVGLVGLWALLPQSIAASQLLSHEKVTPFSNWLSAITMAPAAQARWCGLVIALIVSSLVVVPIFLCFPFAAPALLLERKGVFGSLRRSASLVSWYPVSAMLPLLLAILSIPASWLALEKIVEIVQVQLDPSSAALASIAAICGCALFIALAGACYLVHVFRLYFFHISVHDPRSPELNPMRRLESLK